MKLTWGMCNRGENGCKNYICGYEEKINGYGFPSQDIAYTVYWKVACASSAFLANSLYICPFPGLHMRQGSSPAPSRFFLHLFCGL